MKFFIEVVRQDGSKVLGNLDGQGFYEYANIRNLFRYVIDNPNHIVYKTLNNPSINREFDIEIYSIHGSIYDDSNYRFIQKVLNKVRK